MRVLQPPLVGEERVVHRPERALGVSRLDGQGRPLAWAAVDRYLAGRRGRLGGGVLMPFAMALVEYDLSPQRLALEAAEHEADALIERLSTAEASLVREIASQKGAPAPVDECVQTLKKRRYARERAQLQQEIDRLQAQGTAKHSEQLNELLRRKEELQRIGHTEGLAQS